jgi:DNA mismatch endonuclease (patch repair protein)
LNATVGEEHGTDVLTPQQRAHCMSRIRGRDTRPEMLIRRGLFARGWRYRLHATGLPGRPDMVFPARRAVIFVHGCFWHMHDCHLFTMPATRSDFWDDKLRRNRERDAATLKALELRGWRVLIVWECALKGPLRLALDYVLTQCESWLANPALEAVEIRGSAQVTVHHPSDTLLPNNIVVPDYSRSSAVLGFRKQLEICRFLVPDVARLNLVGPSALYSGPRKPDSNLS